MEFRSLHVPGTPLVLANAWDAGSARLIEAAGGPAVATTSAGISWSLGVPDGQSLDRQAMLAAVQRIVRAVTVPVTADIEAGYGDDLAQTVTEFVRAGVVGINFEDSWHGGPQPLRTIADQAERIAAVRKAGPELFVNARIDTYMTGSRDMADTLARAAAYLDAGADGIFVPGLSDLVAVEELVAQVDAPVNVMAGPGSPSVKEFASVGVARVSLGAFVAAAAYGLAGRAATEALTTGTYESLADLADFAVLQR